ncbi:MAG: C1 family peptidase [Opitutus sp.]
MRAVIKRRTRKSPRLVREGKESATPKTTRPESSSRRLAPAAVSAADMTGRTLDAFPDKIDVRDWFYQPGLASLPDQIVNCDSVPTILDQGSEGACTGFALAAVINFLLAARNREDRSVSPRMLYEMARHYDEWPGEAYEGSSARGAMKGWIAHGVCTSQDWPMENKGAQYFTPTLADTAQLTPGGAYFRVMHKQVRDMHAALNEVGILYVTLMVHAGWNNPQPGETPIRYVENGNLRDRPMALIKREGRADGGHAVAIVGYTREGFIIQNSWGRSWGTDGFALLPYEDYLLHATDVWVAQLGVPVSMNLWEKYATISTAGLHRASAEIPLVDIRPYIIDVGNNGRLSDTGNYWTSEADLERLFTETIPGATIGWKKKRVMLYLHGGLNDEDSVARRVVAFRDVFLQNEIYPLHLMWETGAAESMNGIIRDMFTDDDSRSGSAISDWLHKTRDGLIEAKDRTFELTAARPGSTLWSEMKENARLASVRDGAVQLIAKYVKQAVAKFAPSDRAQWELHLVGHSAGSIFAAYALPTLTQLNIRLTTFSLFAPAITTEAFTTLVLPYLTQTKVPQPSLFILDDVGELDDDVGPYGKSLLYLVSNAFEGKRNVPLVGMQRYLDADPTLKAVFDRTTDGFPRLVIAGVNGPEHSVSRSDSHGGFDNDPATLNSLLCRILNVKTLAEIPRRFEVRDLQF